MGAGKIDYSNLWRDMKNAQRKIGWRKLVCRANGAVIMMYGYACHEQGPWFGYPKVDLKDVPCTHCGQTGIFQDEENWRHHCPGGCDLIEDHLCRGEPNMYHAPMWRCADWYEPR